MSTVKLQVSRQFYDTVKKRLMPINTQFYADTDRATQLVSGGYADVIEREINQDEHLVLKAQNKPKDAVVKSVKTKVVKAKASKSKVVAKPKVAKPKAVK